jgi:hypothetical protein
MRDEGYRFPVHRRGNCQSLQDIRGKYTPDERKGHIVIFELRKKRKKIKKNRAEVM